MQRKVQAPRRSTSGVASGYTGVVKSWNGVKGYGFVTSDQIQGDIMFMRTDLPLDAKEVRGKFLDGKTVTFDAASGPDGRAKASKVQIVAAEGGFLAGEIKSFSERHGYGFITSSSFTEDVRFNVTDLDALTPGAQIRGELVIFKTKSRSDGKVQAERVMFQSSKIANRLKAGGGSRGGPAQGGEQQFGGGMSTLGQGMKRGAAPMGGGFGKMQKLGRGSVATMPTGKHVNGFIKSYNTGKGFGFISTAGVAGDVFFMRTSLPPQAQENRNLSGQAVSFELTQTADGQMRAGEMTLA